MAKPTKSNPKKTVVTRIPTPKELIPNYIPNTPKLKLKEQSQTNTLVAKYPNMGIQPVRLKYTMQDKKYPIPVNDIKK